MYFWLILCAIYKLFIQELLDSGLGDPRKAAVMEKSVRDSHKVLGSSEVCDSSTDGVSWGR